MSYADVTSSINTMKTQTNAVNYEKNKASNNNELGQDVFLQLMITQLQNQEKVLKCECGGNIKPTVLYHGEKYSAPLYEKVKNAIFIEENGKPQLNTHTLIFIGVDFTDSLVSELIDSYDALKDAQHYTVIITDKLNRDDLIYYNPEFGVADDIDAALLRLMDLIKEHE